MIGQGFFMSLRLFFAVMPVLAYLLTDGATTSPPSAGTLVAFNQINDTGLHHAMLITHLHTRLLQPGLAQLTHPDPPAPSALRTAARNYQQALDQLTQEAGFAA
jgi:hypothetical protein